jgi:hypothetical protein
MKGLKLSLIIFVTAILTLGIGGMAYAFHSGGVAECEGCHSMHSPKAGGSFLMVGIDQSSTCLTCHQGATDTGPSSYHVSTAPGAGGAAQIPLQRSPGGDFGWLRKTYTYSTTSSTGVVTNYTEEGQTLGHNIVAADFGYSADTANTQAPGGSFPASSLSCVSCHDPHGQYRRMTDGTIVKGGTTGVATAPIIASGSYPFTATAPAIPLPEVPAVGTAYGVYRLLGGQGYTRGGAFAGVPAAKAPSTYNRTEAVTQTRVAYGNATTGGHVAWGTWCATCHTDMHSSGNYVHPVDETLGSEIANNYKYYKKSGDMSGDGINGFLSLVPFVENTGDYSTLASHAVNNDSVLTGPATNDGVSCLSCHRAHASGNMHALRFDQGYEFITKNGQYVATDHPDYGTWGSRAALQARGRTIADVTAANYGRPATVFATYQRVLCNKCHAKD